MGTGEWLVVIQDVPEQGYFRSDDE